MGLQRSGRITLLIAQWFQQEVKADDLERHDKWACMIYPRLKLIWELLANTGVLFVHIDDNEMHNLRAILDEIFGERNWIGTIVWKNATDNNPTRIAIEHEYVFVCYAKRKDDTPPEWTSPVSEVRDRLSHVEQTLLAKFQEPINLHVPTGRGSESIKLSCGRCRNTTKLTAKEIFTGSRSVHNPGKEGYRYDVPHPVTGKPCKQPLMGYRFPQETMKELLEQKRIIFGKDENKIIEIKLYLREFKDKLPGMIELDGRRGANELRALFPDRKKVFNNPKPVGIGGASPSGFCNARR